MQDALGDIHHGDTVMIDGSILGKVVFCAPSESYSKTFPVLDWPRDEYDGVMIVQENGALLFHESRFFEDGVATIVKINRVP